MYIVPILHAAVDGVPSLRLSEEGLNHMYKIKNNSDEKLAYGCTGFKSKNKIKTKAHQAAPLVIPPGNSLLLDIL